MKPKYLVKPGYVFSKSDGDKHWISADKLIRLYQVNPRECVISHPYLDPEDLIVLEPRYDGNYELRMEASDVQEEF
jgi:hypothetical protein